MERARHRLQKALFLVTMALLVAAVAVAGALTAAPSDAAGQSDKNSPCRKETGISYFGGKGAPYFTGIPNAESYEPETVVDGKRTVVRNLIDVSNASESTACDWRVISKSADWVTLDLESGSLSADSHQLIRVSINDNAKRLRPGTYTARIRFQLGPEADDWYGHATVTLDILDECYIKVRDTERFDIRDGGRAFRWEGTMGRTETGSLRHRIVVWNSSNSRCRLSAEVTTTSSRRWLDAEFDGKTEIGKGDTANLILSAHENWNHLNAGSHQASITIRDAISGADYRLHGVLVTDNEPCQLAVAGESSLRFNAVARSVKSQETRIALENRGVESCDWRARVNQPWLIVTPGEGKILGNPSGDTDTVTITIAGDAANGLKSNPDESHPHSGEVTFSYEVKALPRSKIVPVALHLATPPCDLQTHTPEDMLIHYTPGENINPERHHLKIEASNILDSKECHYKLELPDWLESDDREGVIPEGESRDIIVRLNANSPDAKAGEQEYNGIITFDVVDAPNRKVPVRLETGCPVAEACPYLHTTHKEIYAGGNAVMTYDVVAPINHSIKARLILELPLGWSLNGEGFADKCSGLCTAIYEVPAGDLKSVVMSATANHAGDFELKGRAEYIRPGEETPYAYYQDTVAIRVLEQLAGATLPPVLNPLLPTLAATPIPTITATATPYPTPTPTLAAMAGVAPTPMPTPDALAAPTPVNPPEGGGAGLTRNDIILAGGVGAFGVALLAVVIGGIVGGVIWGIRRLSRPKRQRPAGPPPQQPAPPPTSGRYATPNRRR